MWSTKCGERRSADFQMKSLLRAVCHGGLALFSETKYMDLFRSHHVSEEVLEWETDLQVYIHLMLSFLFKRSEMSLNVFS